MAFSALNLVATHKPDLPKEMGEILA